MIVCFYLEKYLFSTVKQIVYLFIFYYFKGKRSDVTVNKRKNKKTVHRIMKEINTYDETNLTMTSSFERDQSHSEVEMYIVGRIQEEFSKNESQDIELHNMSIDYLEKNINSETNVDTSVGTKDNSLIDISDIRDEHHQSSNDFYPDGNSLLRNENINIDSGAKDVVTVDNPVIKTEPSAVHSGYPGSNINKTEDTSDINFPQGTEKNKIEVICSFITELLHIHDSKIMCFFNRSYFPYNW